MKATFSLLFLIFAITCAMITQYTPYEKFIAQHYQYGMTVKECNKKMAFINKRYNYNRCKRVNSVISALSLDSVNAVCDEDGKPYPMPNRTNLHKSLDQFHVITCKRSNQRGCDYTGSESKRYIIVGCNAGNLPVHYEEDHKF